MSGHVCRDEGIREGGCSISHRPVGHGIIRCRKAAGHRDPCRGRDCQGNIIHFTLEGRTA